MRLAKVLYSDEMGTSVSVTTTFAAMTGSPYNPKATGRLKMVKLFCTGDAATALIEGVQVKLQSAIWAVPLYVMAAGAGIRTAPAFPIAVGEAECDLPVKPGQTITLEVINQTGDTPVTPRYCVIGWFIGEVAQAG